jgi:surfeit locus 1 family protein
VNIVTPLRVAGRDTAVLVNRGWVYSPNGADVDLARWREEDSLDVAGFVEIPSRRDGAARLPSNPRAYRWLDPAQLARDVGYPVTAWYVTETLAPGAPQDTARPARLAPPPLDEGPHLSYALQWFSFAAIALIGGVVFVRSEARARRR